MKIRGTEALGTVYVKHGGRWGTVCDDGFEMKHARVSYKKNIITFSITLDHRIAYYDGFEMKHARVSHQKKDKNKNI